MNVMKPPCTLQARPATGRGFTLVEVLVALVVMATMAAMAWRGIDALVRSREIAQVRLAQTARLQTVHRDDNPRFHGLLSAFEARTGCPVLVNTSFNVRGEPIVESPEDAYTCFMRTGMDGLVLGSFLLRREDQPPFQESEDWRRRHVLD